MNISTLKAAILNANEGSHYFDRATMKHFGDSMGNFGVKSVTVKNRHDQEMKAFAIYRKRATDKGASAGVISYWDAESFTRLHAVTEVE